MKKQELYNIYEGEELLFGELTQEEYFDKMQDLAYEFYENGSHSPEGLRTETIIQSN